MRKREIQWTREEETEVDEIWKGKKRRRKQNMDVLKEKFRLQKLIFVQNSALK